MAGEGGSKFPEKIGEIFLLIIVIVFFLIFGFLLLSFFLAAFGGLTCSISSSMRNLWQSMCLEIPYTGVEVFCVSDLIRGLGMSIGTPLQWVTSAFGFPLKLPSFSTPLFCPTRDYSVGNYQELLDRIALETKTCFFQYGGGKWNVLWFEDNPALCSVLHAEIKENLSVSTIVDYFKSFVLEKKKDCRVCENPCESGFYCYEKDPTKCYRYEANPFICERNVSGYQPCDPGYQLIKEKMRREDCMDFFYNHGLASCDIGYIYDSSSHLCVNKSNPSQTRNLAWPSYLYVIEGGEGYCVYCKRETEKATFVLKPKQCMIFSDIKNESCYVNKTLFDELNGRVIFSIGNFSSKSLTDYYDTYNVTGKIDVFILFLDSFTGSRKAPRVEKLPPECAVSTFKDSCGLCWESCVQPALTTGPLLLLPKGKSRVSTAFKKVGYWYLIGAPWATAECASCLISNFQQADLPICDDKVLICIVQRE